LAGSLFVYLALVFSALAGPSFVVIGLVVEEGVRGMAWTGVVGTVLRALVDPADNAFTIVGR
jgi:hypothetical protein